MLECDGVRLVHVESAVSQTSVKELVERLRTKDAPERLQEIEALVSHPDIAFRMRALQVASEFAHPQARVFCARLLQDPAWSVRCSACEFAYYQSVHEVADQVIDLIENDPNDLVKSYAALAIARIGRQDQVPVLVALVDRLTGFNHEDTPIKDVLSRSIARLQAGMGDGDGEAVR